jgi:hypothetical protein
MNIKIKRLTTAVLTATVTLVSSACTSDTLKATADSDSIFECVSGDYSITLQHLGGKIEATVSNQHNSRKLTGTLENEFLFDTYIRPQVTMHSLDFSIDGTKVSLYDRTDPDIGPEKEIGFTIVEESLETDHACEGASFSKLYLLDNP